MFFLLSLFLRRENQTYPYFSAKRSVVFILVLALFGIIENKNVLMVPLKITDHR